jgi:hypothetical protein
VPPWMLVSSGFSDIRFVPPNSDDSRTIAGGHNAASADK